MNNVMFDLETWGTRPGCAIRSVGAVMFDPYTSDIGDEFYANVDDVSCSKIGLHVDLSTVEWWSRQSQQAQDSLALDPMEITQVVASFHEWFRKKNGVFVWSQGSNFDEVIWAAVVHKLGYRLPWKYNDVRDTRTAYDMAKFNSYAIKRSGTYHNALDDARHQAVCVQRAYAKVNGA